MSHDFINNLNAFTNKYQQTYQRLVTLNNKNQLNKTGRIINNINKIFSNSNSQLKSFNNQ